MKKHLLTAFALTLCICVNAQTHFSQTTGNNFIPAGAYNNTGMASVKTSSGTFITVSVSETAGFNLNYFDTNGTLLFTKEVSNASYDITSVYSVTEFNNELYLSGYAAPAGGGVSNFYLAKINLITNAVTFTVKPVTMMSYTSGPRISVASDGVFASFPQYEKFELSRYDHSLNPLWTKTCEPDSTAGKNPAMDCDRIDDSTIIVLGKCDTDLGWGDYDTSGRLDTFRIYYNPATYTRMYGMTRTADNNIVMAGLTYATSGWDYVPLITKMSREGQIIWSKEMYLSGTAVFQRFVDVIELANGNLVAFATSFEAYNNTYADGVVVFDANGNQLFSKFFGDFYTTYSIYDIKAYSDGILFSGVKSHSDGVNTISENFMAFTDFNLSQMCNVTDYNLMFMTHNMGTLAEFKGNTINQGTGTASITSNFGNMNLTTNGSVVVCSTTLGIEEELTIQTGLYPNPVESGSNLTITLSENSVYAVQITDLTGKLVYTNVINGNSFNMSTSGMSSGAYLVSVSHNGTILTTEKLMVK